MAASRKPRVLLLALVMQLSKGGLDPERFNVRGLSPDPTHLSDMVEVAGGFVEEPQALPYKDTDKDGNAVEAPPPKRNMIRSFMMDKTAVSNEQFARFVNATGYQSEAHGAQWSMVLKQFLRKDKGQLPHKMHPSGVPKVWTILKWSNWKKPVGNWSDADPTHPVVHVSWYDSLVYCNWAGRRLPSEGEWELAARGGLEGKQFPWGDESMPEGEHRCNAWDGPWPRKKVGFNMKGGDADGFLMTAPVTHFPPNAYGLYNMVGNVWEWTLSEFQLGDGGGMPPKQAIRGGSHIGNFDGSVNHEVGIAARQGYYPDSGFGDIGFRCAQSLPGREPPSIVRFKQMRMVKSGFIKFTPTDKPADAPEEGGGGAGGAGGGGGEGSGLQGQFVTGAVWITLPLDHFNTAEARTFDCRYYVDDSAWKQAAGTSQPAALFFVMGGEGPCTGVGNDYVNQLAAARGARVVAIEHRFYGKSVPGGVPNASSPGGLATDNLRFLTSRQALADAAALIDSLNPVVAGGARAVPVFTFGGSYSGALSAWFRALYPTHTRGSLSSSGVVNTIFDFVGFDEQVRAAIGDACAQDWDGVTAAFDAALAAGGADAAAAKALFGLPAKYLDADFYYMIADAASMADQAELCAMLAGTRGAAPARVRAAFSAWVSSYYGTDFGAGCFYDTGCLADAARAGEWQPTNRAWRWQKCNEVAYLQPAPASKPLRSRHLTLAAEVTQCAAVFGGAPAPYAGPEAGAAAALAAYGGATLAGQNASRIFFSDFSDDPWQRASVRTELAPDLPYSYVTCDGCGHCMDLHAANATSDPPALTRSRERFESKLDAWLAGAEFD
eukprot:g6933.t1